MRWDDYWIDRPGTQLEAWRRLQDIECGFPLRCMKARLVTEGKPNSPITVLEHGGLRFRYSEFGWNVPLPVRVKPLAFAVDVSCFAVLIIYVARLFTYATLRRRNASRIAKGLCSKCGYDRRGLAPDILCPECGKAPLA